MRDALDVVKVGVRFRVSGVGTAMTMTSISGTRSKSSVASMSPASDRLGQLGIVDVADVVVAGVDLLGALGVASMPMTRNPTLAFSTANGRPT